MRTSSGKQRASTRGYRGAGGAREQTTDQRPSDAPKSAARLAAEQAFSAPLQQTSLPADQPVVIVRRSRALETSTPVTPAPAVGDQVAASPPESVAPRIFRVDTAPALREAAAAPATALSGALPFAEPDARPATRQAPRRQRLDSLKRPGPVQQIYRAPAGSATPAGTGRAEAAGPRYTAGMLQDMLAGLDALFDDIRLAQSFRFLEPR